MIAFVIRFWHWLLRLLRGERPGIAVEFLDNEPERPKASILYVIGGQEHPWKATLICPCGCQEVIELNLSPPGPPLWRIVKVEGKRVTLAPSVWRTKGCRSHFWLRDGEVQWCNAADQPG